MKFSVIFVFVIRAVGFEALVMLMQLYLGEKGESGQKAMSVLAVLNTIARPLRAMSPICAKTCVISRCNDVSY